MFEVKLVDGSIINVDADHIHEASDGITKLFKSIMTSDGKFNRFGIMQFWVQRSTIVYIRPTTTPHGSDEPKSVFNVLTDAEKFIRDRDILSINGFTRDQTADCVNTIKLFIGC